MYPSFSVWPQLAAKEAWLEKQKKWFPPEPCLPSPGKKSQEGTGLTLHSDLCGSQGKVKDTRISLLAILLFSGADGWTQDLALTKQMYLPPVSQVSSPPFGSSVLQLSESLITIFLWESPLTPSSGSELGDILRMLILFKGLARSLREIFYKRVNNYIYISS